VEGDVLHHLKGRGVVRDGEMSGGNMSGGISWYRFETPKIDDDDETSYESGKCDQSWYERPADWTLGAIHIDRIKHKGPRQGTLHLCMIDWLRFYSVLLSKIHFIQYFQFFTVFYFPSAVAGQVSLCYFMHAPVFTGRTHNVFYLTVRSSVRSLVRPLPDVWTR